MEKEKIATLEPSEACETCVFYNPEGLKKLGVNIDNVDYVVALA